MSFCFCFVSTSRVLVWKPREPWLSARGLRLSVDGLPDYRFYRDAQRLCDGISLLFRGARLLCCVRPWALKLFLSSGRLETVDVRTSHQTSGSFSAWPKARNASFKRTACCRLTMRVPTTRHLVSLCRCGEDSMVRPRAVESTRLKRDDEYGRTPGGPLNLRN